MRERLTVITAIYDGYDTLKPTLEQDNVDVDWVCVTDVAPSFSNGWRIIIEPRPGQHPNVAAKRPKMLPWDYRQSELPDAEHLGKSLWLDASFRVTSPHMARDICTLLKVWPIYQFRHPWRDCIYDEADASMALPKYAHQRDIIAQQVEMYRKQGHPEHWGLWATGVIARSHMSGQIRRFGTAWLRACQEWSYQDQVSEAVHLRDQGLAPQPLPGNHFSNPWLVYEGSSRH